MEEFDEFFSQLVANNETKREENDRNAHLLYNKLWLAEEKVRERERERERERLRDCVFRCKENCVCACVIIICYWYSY